MSSPWEHVRTPQGERETSANPRKGRGQRAGLPRRTPAGRNECSRFGRCLRITRAFPRAPRRRSGGRLPGFYRLGPRASAEWLVVFAGGGSEQISWRLEAQERGTQTWTLLQGGERCAGGDKVGGRRSTGG